MSLKSEIRRELGLIAAEYMQLSTDIGDAMATFEERAEVLHKKVTKKYKELDEALDADH